MLWIRSVPRAVLGSHQCPGDCWALLAKRLSASDSAFPVSGLRVGRQLGKNTARTVDLRWLKWYSKPCKGYWIPYNIMGSSKTRVLSFQRSYCSETRGAVCLWEGVSDCLCITWLVFFFFLSFPHFKLSSPWPMSFSCLTFLVLPYPTKAVGDQLWLNCWGQCTSHYRSNFFSGPVKLL